MRGGWLRRVSVAMVLVGAAIPAPALAAFPGQNGLIAFDTCGSAARPVLPRTGGRDDAFRWWAHYRRERGVSPSWSADGTQIVYVQGGDIGDHDAYGHRSDDLPLRDRPSGPRPLWKARTTKTPVWSPDGIRHRLLTGTTTRTTRTSRSLAVGTPGRPSAESSVYMGYPRRRGRVEPGRQPYLRLQFRADRGVGAGRSVYTACSGRPRPRSSPGVNTSPDGTRIVFSRNAFTAPYERPRSMSRRPTAQARPVSHRPLRQGLQPRMVSGRHQDCLHQRARRQPRALRDERGRLEPDADHEHRHTA